MKDESEFVDCAKRLKAVADADRLKIVTALFAGPKNVGDLAAELHEEVVNVSHHLGVLRNADIVLAQKQGRFVVYSLHPDVVVSEAAATLSQIDFGCCKLDLSEKK